MIQDSHIKQQATIFDLLGDITVSFAGDYSARRVVVTQDDPGSMLLKANLEDLLWINDGSRNPTFRNLDLFNDPVCPVQH